MTKYPPASDGYQPGNQYGQSGPPYGNYPSGEYNQQQNTYDGGNQGSAQGYYGSNDQAYQQYPQDRPPPSVNYYQGPPQPPYPQHQPQYNEHQYGGPPQYDQRQQQYASPPPQYNQEYPAAPQQWDRHHNVPHMPPQGQYPPGPSQYPSGPSQYGPGQTEPDRGIMGALAGGAAGAYGGHKMNHGILGGIGGAVAGSMLEDAYKKKHKKSKKPHKKSRRGSNSSSSSSSSWSSDSDSSKKKKKHGGGYAGNFHASSRNVRLEGRSMLVADCADTRGHFRQSTIELNDCFTNTNGKLAWVRGGGFALSARGIKLADGGKVMECELGNGHGGFEYNWVRLDERITNEDGHLRML